jgi:hypothetical protein
MSPIAGSSVATDISGLCSKVFPDTDSSGVEWLVEYNSLKWSNFT